MLSKTSRYDIVIVGGGTAGLSAALILGRSLRWTLVLDTGEPRNAPSSGVNGFFSHDGIRPEELLEIGREQLKPYPNVELRQARAVRAKGEDGDFEVALNDGSSVRARKLLLTSGVVDELPETPGFQELWGRGVYHCPYCHGWEVRDRPLAVLNSTDRAVGYAVMIRNWSRDIFLLTNGHTGLDEEGRRKLDALGVPIIEERISCLEGDPSEAGRGLRRIVFEDGSSLEREGVFYVPPQRHGSDLARYLGCGVSAMGPSTVVENEALTGETTVPGVYVAGDVGSPSGPIQSAILAAASGARAAYYLNHALVAEDAKEEIEAPQRTPGR